MKASDAEFACQGTEADRLNMKRIATENEAIFAGLSVVDEVAVAVELKFKFNEERRETANDLFPSRSEIDRKTSARSRGRWTKS
jgi:ABC-type branched-subunit amino acid transport system ATPase component